MDHKYNGSNTVAILYYHLYPGQYLERTLTEHEKILIESDFDEIIIMAPFDPSIDKCLKAFVININTKTKCKVIRPVFSKNVNEFATLELLQNDLKIRHDDEWIAYAHTKGVTYSDDQPVVKKSKFQISNLVNLLKIIKKNSTFREIYNAAGSDMVVGNFNPCGPSNLAFAGNIWIAKASYLKNLPVISNKEKYLMALRFQAEAWIGKSSKLSPFNSHCSFRFHYDNHPNELKVRSFQIELESLLANKDDFKEIQEYYKKIIEYQKNKLDGVMERAYPRSLSFKRKIGAFVYSTLKRSALLFRILNAISYKLRIAHSPFALLYLDIPSQLDISRHFIKRSKGLTSPETGLSQKFPLK